MAVTILRGDCRDVLTTIAPQSVNCIVTSPPYYGLRDYGVDGQIGLEKSPDEYVAELVAVFREARRVLRDDGTLWLNIGDSYNGGGLGGGPKGKTLDGASDRDQQGNDRKTLKVHGLKPKDLIGIPWRVAFALQADGWYLRSDIIWHKPNPMPESVKDRPTNAHEHVFLFAKSASYHYDADAVKERAVQPERAHDFGRPSRNERAKAFGHLPTGNEASGSTAVYGTRNLRNVWTITPKPFKGAHFAVFPPALIEPCIKAGCPIGGTVLDPFGGSGTTGLVAQSLGRNATLIELNPAYAAMAQERVAPVLVAAE